MVRLSRQADLRNIDTSPCENPLFGLGSAPVRCAGKNSAR